MQATVALVLVGGLRPLGPKARPSGIFKTPIGGPVQVTPTGLSGDAQGDLKAHGGPEKAIHHYPRDHYAAWLAELGAHPALEQPGAFGENLSTFGWTEETVHIGDVVRCGDAVLQVSQGRQPCWKLDARFAHPGMALDVQSSGRTGWYYRVLEEGEALPRTPLALLDRSQPEWPLSRISHLLYRDRDNYPALEQMAEIPELAERWREIARRRLLTRLTEDWSTRLHGDRATPEAI